MHSKQHFTSFVPTFAYAILTYEDKKTSHLIWRHEAVDISVYLISDVADDKTFKLLKNKIMAV